MKRFAPVSLRSMNNAVMAINAARKDGEFVPNTSVIEAMVTDLATSDQRQDHIELAVTVRILAGLVVEISTVLAELQGLEVAKVFELLVNNNNKVQSSGTSP